MSTQAAQRAKQPACRDVRPVDRNIPCTHILFGVTQRPRGLMADDTTSLNNRSVSLYTPCWLGCQPSLRDEPPVAGSLPL
ncbi:hypothetical protein IC229_29020 [Spirosoma sp. BT702]|uniref:Uncharacterized protein n=1 Tax=Spirosoma profusum TaxID=2771354 RepID=A0A927AUL8_9BACT|nr:hypothetical protein [Spirosoma profusum]MBD2704712.1 hypothetical protein [Spirosoma profusum]